MNDLVCLESTKERNLGCEWSMEGWHWRNDVSSKAKCKKLEPKYRLCKTIYVEINDTIMK